MKVHNWRVEEVVEGPGGEYSQDLNLKRQITCVSKEKSSVTLMWRSRGSRDEVERDMGNPSRPLADRLTISAEEDENQSREDSREMWWTDGELI